MRIAALKLLLTLVTILDQSASTYKQQLFSPGDLSRALSIVRGVGNVDADPDVRKLASYLSAVLQ